VIRVILPEPLDGAEDEAHKELAECKMQDEYDTKLGAYMRWYGVPGSTTATKARSAGSITYPWPTPELLPNLSIPCQRSTRHKK
jgi:hypothetical protein